ncbi:SDR family NAD(P)-dependent oxidoreductase [uncultured Oscillibacter sp.]|uniref:SDR family NAD(P)-dependent oxidoreductase n=1 Tax=uncultured Oscillibacter sp. TaxID=876091 RepID=UPI0025D2A5BE|nr:SDR family oxidoreductase [uncultured Oscillibacter sp.]
MVLNLFDLAGRTAIVTGACKGLGRKEAEALHEAGAAVVLVDIMEQVRDTAGELAAAGGAPVYAIVGNLLDRDDLDRVFREAVETLGGRLDILVNNAGTHCKGPTIGYQMKDWDRIIALNLTAQFMMCQRAGEVMVRQGYGKIINICSAVGVTGGLHCTAYSASKGGINTMTKTLSNEWAGSGVCVNAIAPGYINTDINKASSPKRRAYISSRIPKGCWGEPEMLKGTVVFLASDASDYVTGVILPVDGGYLSR